MASAPDLYHSIGFVEVGPYFDNPTPGETYLRLSCEQLGRRHCTTQYP